MERKGHIFSLEEEAAEFGHIWDMWGKRDGRVQKAPCLIGLSNKEDVSIVDGDRE